MHWWHALPDGDKGVRTRCSDDMLWLVWALCEYVEKTGDTVIVIEHNLDVIKVADHLIEMGPEGGRGGGEVVFTGTPEEMVAAGIGQTAPFLKKELESAGKSHD